MFVKQNCHSHPIQVKSNFLLFTSTNVSTFKGEKVYENPTEEVGLEGIVNISKSDEETHRQFSFVKIVI